MKSFSDMQSTAGNLFAAYAQLAAYKMLFRSVINDFIPASVTSRIWSLLSRFFTPPTKLTTIVIEEHTGMSRNAVFESAQIYLGTKASSNTDRFKVSKIPKQKSLFITMDTDQLVTDTFKDDIHLRWRFVAQKSEDNRVKPEQRFFELSFSKEFKEVVVDEYLPFVLDRAEELKNSDKAVKIFSQHGNGWSSVNLEHPSTFEKLAMEPEMKKDLIRDLDRFVRRKEYYRQVGKAWKRGYLLYGPPGTGKSSLIAAMANYLKFDVYDLEINSFYSDSQLRNIMLTTTNRSIIVIEDIDCNVETHHRGRPRYTDQPSNTKLSLSGLLNFIDGLWSCCGDERIIIFTTNHKEKLDSALLRPGRMDMHIHLSYITPAGFRTLASNYLGVDRQYNEKLFDEIEGLMESCEVTPAVIAEELMRSEDADAALEGVKTLLNQKLAEKNAASAAAQVKDDKDVAVSNPEQGDDDDDDHDDDKERLEEAVRMLEPEFRRRFVRGWKGRGGG